MESVQFIFRNEALFAGIVDAFSYPIQIYAADGTSVMVNQAFLNEYHIPSADRIVGKYNVLNDLVIIKQGLLEPVKRAFRGENIFLADVKIPIEDFAQKYAIADDDIETIYQDITAFPMRDSDGKVAYVIVMLITKRKYRGKLEIIKGKEYIENNWQEAFDLNGAAKAAGLSKTHFTRLFKKHTGATPHHYYVDIKIGKIREQLGDITLSISQVFAKCGVDYNGHFAKLFKEKVGVTPSTYRKMNR